MTKATPFIVFAAAFALAGCAGQQRVPSKYDRPIKAIAHVQPLGAKQQFVLCDVCPKPTPKTLALPAEDGAPAKPQAELPKFTYIPAPIAGQESATDTDARIVVPFAYNSHQLGPRGKRAVSNLIEKMQAMDLSGYSDIVAHGFTDDLGTEKYNGMLGFKRANTVIKALRAAGIKAPLSAMADGECCFVSNNTDETRRAPNRRVEVVFVKRK